MRERKITGFILIIIGVSLLGFSGFMLTSQKSMASNNELVKIVKCDVDHDPFDPGEELEHHCPDVTPTPTPIVTPIPVATQSAQVSQVGGWSPSPQGNFSTTNPIPAPICTIPFDGPKLQGFKRLSPTSVQFDWWKSSDGNVNKQSVIYGYANGAWQFGQDNLSKNDTSIILNDLAANQTVWGEIIAWKNGCPSFSNPLDP